MGNDLVPDNWSRLKTKPTSQTRCNNKNKNKNPRGGQGFQRVSVELSVVTEGTLRWWWYTQLCDDEALCREDSAKFDRSLQKPLPLGGIKSQEQKTLNQVFSEAFVLWPPWAMEVKSQGLHSFRGKGEKARWSTIRSMHVFNSSSKISLLQSACTTWPGNQGWMWEPRG